MAMWGSTVPIGLSVVTLSVAQRAGSETSDSDEVVSRMVPPSGPPSGTLAGNIRMTTMAISSRVWSRALATSTASHSSSADVPGGRCSIEDRSSTIESVRAVPGRSTNPSVYRTKEEPRDRSA